MATKSVTPGAILTAGLLLLLLLIGTGVSFAQTPALRVRFLGPDSGHLDIKSLQVCPDRNGRTMLGALLKSWATAYRGGRWIYWTYPFGPDFEWMRDDLSGFWFSPWEDSVQFLSCNFVNNNNGLSACSIARGATGAAMFGANGFYIGVRDPTPVVLFLNGNSPLVFAKSSALDGSSDSGKTWAFSFNGNYGNDFSASDLVVSDVASRELLRAGLVKGPDGFGIEASSDLGKTWVRRHTFAAAFLGLPNEKCRLYPARGRMYLRSGVLASEGPPGTAIRLSVDGGTSWALRGLFPTDAGLAVDTANAQRIFVVYSDTLCWSFDEGQHWTKVGLGLQRMKFSMAVIDPETGALIAASDGQGIYAIDGIPTSIEHAIAYAEKMEMGSPYPNPAHEDVFIPLTLEKGSTALVTIHDALGRRVATLHDGLLSTGSHSLRQSVTGLAKGMYAVRVSCAGRVSSRQFAIE